MNNIFQKIFILIFLIQVNLYSLSEKQNLITEEKFLNEYFDDYNNYDKNLNDHFLLYNKNQNYKLYITEFQKILNDAIEKTGKFSNKTAVIYNMLITIYTDKGEYKSALKYLDKLFLIYTKHGVETITITQRRKNINLKIAERYYYSNKSPIEKILARITILTETEKYNDALELALKSLKTYKKDDIYSVLLNISIVRSYKKLGQEDKIFKYLNQALKLETLAPSPKGFTSKQKNLLLADIYLAKLNYHFQKKEYKETIKSYERAIDLISIETDAINLTNKKLFNNIADAYILYAFETIRINPKEALRYIAKSIIILKNLNKKNNIRLLQAEYALMSAINIKEKNQTEQHYIRNLINSFKLYEKIQKTLADDEFMNSIGSEEIIEYINLYIMLSKNIGFLYSKIGEYELSLKFFKNAIRTSNTFNYKLHLDSIYGDIGDMYIRQNKPDQALEFYQKISINLKKPIESNSSIIQNFYQTQLSNKYEKQSFIGILTNDIEKSYQNIKKATLLETSNIEEVFPLLSTEEKLRYKQLQGTPKLSYFITYLYINKLKRNDSIQVKKVLEEAFNNWIRRKGSILNDENILSNMSITTHDKNIQIKIKKLKSLTNKLSTLLIQDLKNMEWEEKVEVKYKQEALENEIKNIQLILAKHNKLYKEETGLFNISNVDIANQLKNNEVYIDFIKEHNEYYIFTLNKNHKINFIQINTEDSKTLELHIKNLKSNNQKMVQAIKNKTIKKEQAQLKKESHVILSKLYDILISKYLRTQLQATKELIISPDGLLNFLPFEALYHNGKYLIEDYKISYTSSGREFLRQTKREPYKVGSRKMICFGNPDFNASLPKSTTKNFFGGGNQQVEETWEQYKKFSVIGDEEIVTIKNLYKDALIYEDKEANVENLMKVGASQILHFSTHGKFLNNQTTIENPMLKAGIALSGANVKGDLLGIVTALKVSALDLSNTELVVLSACQSGLGEVQNGEGVMGLPKAFLQAGAREVIMSLWSVSNQKTAILMQKFYTNVQNNQDYNTALKNAKLDMIKKKMHPYYWSAFIMHGIQN